METIRYTKMDRQEIINTLMHRGILAFPTDTVFGLACIMDKEAMEKVYAAKDRDRDKPLPMMCCDLEMIRHVAEVSETAEKVIRHFIPGPLTVILKKKKEVEDYVTQGKDTIGIRVPDDEFILDLIRKLDQPLMVTSANISGDGSLLKWKDVLSCMDSRIDGIVCEDARGEKASTIADLTEELRILREGPISLREIEEVIQ